MGSDALRANGGACRRQWKPTLEGLETRALLSSGTIGPDRPGRHEPAAAIMQFVPILYPPGTPQPTAAEISRESFVVKAKGSYTIGPGGFSSQTITIHGFGKPGTSNLMLRTHFQFVISEPVNPSQAVTGAIDFTSANYLQNSSNLILDLVGPTGSEVDGLPTHLNWAHDAASGTAFNGPGDALPAYNNFPGNYFNANGSFATPAPGTPGGGAPTSVANWNMGLGDMTLKFVPNAHPAAGSLGSGTVFFQMRGLLNYSGAQSQDDKSYN
jgi:hypothetical protein